MTLPQASESPMNKGDAESLCIRMNETMDALNNVIEAETRLVRAGKVREAGYLQAEKADLAKRYMELLIEIQNHAQTLSLLIPEMVERTRRRHESFRIALQSNMNALDIARSVSEQLIKDVAAEVGSKKQLNTYGMNGMQAQQYITTPAISIDRAL